MNHKIDRDTYIIPPNFIESGTFFGGMFKARNVIEAGILAFAIGVPVFSLLPLGLTARIIALCLTALPAALVALIGISGESLSSFLLIFIKYLRNRRIVGGNSAEDAVPAAEHGGKHIKKKAHKPDKAPRRSRRSGREDFPAEFDEVRSYEIRQKLRPVKKQKPAKEKKAAKQKKKVSKERKVKRPIRTQEPKPACLNPVADYLPISKIENGIIYTKDHRYVKVVEVVPINFMLRSAQEQRNIIYSFVSYLKISPIKLQIKVLTRRAEINRHLDTVRKEMEQETNEQCLLMQEDYLQFVQQIGSREAITRRFFLIFEYEPWSNTKRSDEEGEAINALQSAVHTATNYLRQCGNEVIVPENWDEFTVDVLYNLLCRNESAVKPLSVRAQEVVAEYLAKGRDSEIDHIPATEFCAPKSIDFTHGHHICIDGLYYAYLLVPSDGYKTQVPAGWLSLIVNAGDGIDMDMFLSRQPKETIIQILGTSGAGKTFTMQLMALRMRRKNIPIFIVAPLKGHEFHRACSNVGGSFIQISPASPHCINVMEIRRVDRSVNELLDGPGIQLSELAAKIQQLHIFFSLLIPDMSHEERQLLDEALVRTYNTKGITHDNASLEDPAQPGQYREMPVLGDLYEILKTSKETMRMAHILNRLVNGSASTFNKQTNVRLDNKYTVLDISSLTGDLLTVGMFVALDFVWDRAKADRTEEKAIFIDECWQLLSGAGAAGVRLAGDFLLEIAKTIRGYGGASIFASQDLADFFDLDGGRFGKGIINNSKTKIILNLEDDEAQRVQEALHLSDAETMEITHFERGHGLISTNNNNIMVEFKASPLEKDLITTDRRELREIVERKRREQSTSAEQQI